MMKWRKLSQHQQRNNQLFKPDRAATNCLVTNIQHKRNSCDIRTFLQIYRKKSRAAFIQKEFQTSIDKLSIPECQLRKGFKGSQIYRIHTTSQTINQYNQRPETAKMRKLSVRTQASSFWSYSQLKEKSQKYQILKHKTMSISSPLSELQIVPKPLLNKKTNLKPNLMYNLSLYKNKTRPKFNKYQKDQNKANQLRFFANGCQPIRSNFLNQPIF